MPRSGKPGIRPSGGLLSERRMVYFLSGVPRWLTATGRTRFKMTSMGGPQCSNPQWSPDGKSIVFNSRPGGHGRPLHPRARHRRGPSNNARPLGGTRTSVVARRAMDLLRGQTRRGRFEVWRMPGAGGATTQITQQGGVTATESPDGSSCTTPKITNRRRRSGVCSSVAASKFSSWIV